MTKDEHMKAVNAIRAVYLGHILDMQLKILSLEQEVKELTKAMKDRGETDAR